MSRWFRCVECREFFELRRAAPETAIVGCSCGGDVREVDLNA